MSVNGQHVCPSDPLSKIYLWSVPDGEVCQVSADSIFQHPRCINVICELKNTKLILWFVNRTREKRKKERKGDDVMMC